MASNRLLVEGVEDIHAIAQLIGHFVLWPREDPPVRIVDCNGDELLQGARISTEIKTYDAVGVVLDADQNLAGRWNTVRNQATSIFTVPAQLPAEGLILSNQEGRRFGVWIMPDNQQHGMLETFLKLLVPVQRAALWEYAEAATVEARNRGALFSTAHTDKAKMHTWLAWMEPPGQSLGHAIRARILDPSAVHAQNFVSWFIGLYGLERKAAQR